MSILDIVIFIVIFLAIIGIIVWINQPIKQPTHTLKAIIVLKGKSDLSEEEKNELEENLLIYLNGSGAYLKSEEISFKYDITKDTKTINIITHTTTTIDKIAIVANRLNEASEYPETLAEKVFNYVTPSPFYVDKVLVFTGDLNTEERDAINIKAEKDSRDLYLRALDVLDLLPDGVDAENATKEQVQAAEAEADRERSKKSASAQKDANFNRCIPFEEFLPEAIESCEAAAGQVPPKDINYAIDRAKDPRYIADAYDHLIYETAYKIAGPDGGGGSGGWGGWSGPCTAALKMPIATKMRECMQWLPNPFKKDDYQWYKTTPDTCKDLILFLDTAATLISTKLAWFGFVKHDDFTTQYKHIKMHPVPITHQTPQILKDRTFYFKRDETTGKWSSIQCLSKNADPYIPNFIDCADKSCFTFLNDASYVPPEEWASMTVDDLVPYSGEIGESTLVPIPFGDGIEDGVSYPPGQHPDVLNGPSAHLMCRNRGGKPFIAKDTCPEHLEEDYEDAFSKCDLSFNKLPPKLKSIAYPTAPTQGQQAPALFPPAVYSIGQNYAALPESSKELIKATAEKDVEDVKTLLKLVAKKFDDKGNDMGNHISDTPLPHLLMQQSIKCQGGSAESVDLQACNNMWTLAIEYTKDVARYIDTLPAGDENYPRNGKYLATEWLPEKSGAGRNKEFINSQNLLKSLPSIGGGDDKWAKLFTLDKWNTRCANAI